MFALFQNCVLEFRCLNHVQPNITQVLRRIITNYLLKFYNYIMAISMQSFEPK